MSLTECDLRNKKPERPGEFTFTWSAQNYSYCTKDYLESPDFAVEFLGETKWWLALYPRGNKSPGFVSCYLCGSHEEPPFNFTLAIRKSDGQFKESGENVYDGSKYWKGYSRFVSLEELKGSDAYLDNDMLTVRCRMWKTGVGIPTSVKWEAHSRIKVSKLDYTWIVNDISVANGEFENEFNKSVDITKYFTTNSEINLNLFKKERLGVYSLQFGIEMIKPKKKYFWVAVVHLMAADASVAHSARGESLFHRSDEKLLRDFSLISKDKLYTNEKLFLPNNQLTLSCELSFSADNEFETLVFRKIKEQKSATINKQTDLQGVWIKNMQQCYKEGKFSDLIIHNHGRQFYVSRNILSAHSEVFDAMFERDMKERKTGIVDIEDLDEDTVSNMLKYVYTSTLDSTDRSNVQKLYLAADKYGIAALQKKCSIFLMGCLDVSNVCDILELADKHQDHDLKSRARDFVSVHAQEIIVSDAWKKLMETNSHLTCEVFQWMFYKKFLNEEK